MLLRNAGDYGIILYTHQISYSESEEILHDGNQTRRSSLSTVQQYMAILKTFSIYMLAQRHTCKNQKWLFSSGNNFSIYNIYILDRFGLEQIKRYIFILVDGGGILKYFCDKLVLQNLWGTILQYIWILDKLKIWKQILSHKTYLTERDIYNVVVTFGCMSITLSN